VLVLLLHLLLLTLLSKSSSGSLLNGGRARRMVCVILRRTGLQTWFKLWEQVLGGGVELVRQLILLWRVDHGRRRRGRIDWRVVLAIAGRFWVLRHGNDATEEIALLASGQRSNAS